MLNCTFISYCVIIFIYIHTYVYILKCVYVYNIQYKQLTIFATNNFYLNNNNNINININHLIKDVPCV